MKNSHKQRKLKFEKLKVAKLDNLDNIVGGRVPLRKTDDATHCPTQEER